MRALALGIVASVALHAFVLFFGGVFFFSEEEAAARGPAKEVELFSEEASPSEPAVEPKSETETRPEEKLETPEERPPEMKEPFEPEEAADSVDSSDAIAGLEALSLEALESALSGAGGGEDGAFGVAASLASGGRIGGTGPPGASTEDGPLQDIFDVVDLDQPPRPVFQTPPNYPSELRRQKVEGTVVVVFVIDPEGKVRDPKVERSSHPEFERPTLEAVRKWRFDPAIRGGDKVSARLRIPIRFAVGN